MSEDELQKLKNLREAYDKAYIEFKGMTKGIRLTKLSQTDENFLKLVELIMDGFKGSGDSINLLLEGQILLRRRVESLEKEVKQLRETFDTLGENR